MLESASSLIDIDRLDSVLRRIGNISYTGGALYGEKW